LILFLFVSEKKSSFTTFTRSFSNAPSTASLSLFLLFASKKSEEKKVIEERTKQKEREEL